MRYDNKTTLINSNLMYRKKFLDRGVNFIEYEQIPDLRYPNQEEKANLDIIVHTWKTGDRLYKLAHKYYGDSKLWWVIAFYNARPTESHYAYGANVEIPLPLERILEYMGY